MSATRHLNALHRILDDAWYLRGIPGSSDRYIMHVCSLLSFIDESEDPTESIEELIDLLDDGVVAGIPATLIAALQGHATALLKCVRQ